MLYLQSQHCSNVFRKGFVLMIYLQAGFVLLPPVLGSLARQRWVICDASARVERCCRPMAHSRTAAISCLYVTLRCPPLKKRNNNNLLEALIFHPRSSVCYPQEWTDSILHSQGRPLSSRAVSNPKRELLKC